MTDSMKFGPEWLRNLSTDSTTNSAAISSGGGGGGNGNTSSNLNSSISSPIIASSNFQHGNITSTVHLSGQQRNLFPQFRYGREELLSLFEKNCKLPEILPGYKKLFVEKVQVPLALTPSTDEEVFTQVTAPPTQRPTWIRRSPVGFPPSTRGTGRGGSSVDRGRMRGKSVYHPVYQRTAANITIYDDARPPLIKPERGWAERNGATEGIGPEGGYTSTNIVTEWNGTPASSPRKEFSSHSRNLENWRKNRTEDGSGDAPASTIVGADGWRGSSSFGTHRWGRSTSWRDEDTAAPTSAETYGSSVVSMQRSFSTISTTVTERGGYGGGNSISKSSSMTSALGGGVNQIGNRQVGVNSGTASGGRNNQWTTSSGDSADDLPEWAMENPSDSGGTFDASGAFHGSVEYNHSMSGSKSYTYPNALKKSASSHESLQTSTQENCKEEDDSQPEQDDGDKTYISEDSAQNKALQSVADFDAADTNIDENHAPPHAKNNCDDVANQSEKLANSSASSESNSSENKAPLMQTEIVEKEVKNANENVIVRNALVAQQQQQEQQHKQYQQQQHQQQHQEQQHQHQLLLQSTNSHSDLSDRMQEVADDMVEKLIMDDDSEGIKTSGANKNSKPISAAVVTSGMNMPNAFVVPAVAAILKQTAAAQQQASTNIGASSPSLPTMTTNQKVMPLFGGGLVVDHATMQQHHLQQQQLAAASAAASLQSTMNSASSVDLWYYRDPQSKVQGPFTAIEMTEWYRAGYFDENLFVRRVCDARFRALGELIKLCHGSMPFTHTHLIPLGIDNVNIVNNNVATIRQVRDKQPQANNDFGLNPQQQQQHQEHREELKGNVTAAADSLSAAVKNLINPVDMSHILNMHFQMLQEQYLRHQEMMVVAEYSSKECFQRLTPSEREAVVRQKVQMLGLPEYLTSLAGLSNSLATLNPSAGNQLYDVIAECSKKEQHFANSAPQTQAQHQHQPQLAIANSFMDRDDFLVNAQKQQQNAFGNVPYGAVNSENTTATNVANIGNDMSANDLINDYNLRMLLRGNNMNAAHAQQPKTQASADYDNDFLAQQQLIAVASQSPALQMWMPHLATNNNVQQPQQQQQQQQQQQFLSQQPPTQASNNQWTGNSLVHMPNTAIAGPAPMTNITPAKSMPSSMWEILPLEQVQNQHQFQANALNFDVQTQPHPQQNNLAKEHQHQARVEQENLLENRQQTSPTHSQVLEITPKTSSPTQQPTGSSKSRKEDVSEKQQQQQLQQQVSSNKRANNKPQSSQSTRKECKDESTINKKYSEEERRRESAEEKRRQKDEKKRQQAEDEKRRLQLIEEEKNRQLLEERERQQQIQAQRRKAMLGNAAAANAAPNTANTKSSKDQRIQSSVAPWSAQSTVTVGNSGPSLAEIQKAERRERRADQQRQTEILEKQLRANTAAAAENNDAFLKWNASPVPVKSFAQIQAEESKRLAAEQLEIQRRKEQEQAAAIVSNLGVGVVSNVGSGVSSNNLSAIWSGSKVWGSTSNAGFWEEPIKFSAALAAVPVSTAVSANAVVGKPQSPLGQQKLQVTSSQQTVSAASSSNRNLTKSQTVSTMQNTSNTGSNKHNQHSVSGTSSTQAQKQQQKTNANANAEKKSGNGKSQPSNTANYVASYAASSNKKDDYQNEFTGWCMKSLGGMNTKVDVPTFVTFLQDLESPYEVKDYVRMYLGESKEFTEFAKQFLERRSKYKNLQRAQNAHNDDMCKPAPAITPSGNDSLENKGKQKKVKKGKMTKLDARILGFSVTAAEGRINVGDRDYVDAP